MSWVKLRVASAGIKSGISATCNYNVPRMGQKSVKARPHDGEWLDDIRDWCGTELHQLVAQAQSHTTWQQTVVCVGHQSAITHELIYGWISATWPEIEAVTMHSLLEAAHSLMIHDSVN